MSSLRLAAAPALFALALTAVSCADDDDVLPLEDAYRAIVLVTEDGADLTVGDPNLVVPWGIAYGADTPFWVANNGTSTATIYDGDGDVLTDDVLGGPVSIPAPPQPLLAGGLGIGDTGPTGIVHHAGSGFDVSGAPSQFILATTAGTLAGWNPQTEDNQAVIAVDVPGAAYTGLAIDEDTSRLYAASFAEAQVDVYDESFERLQLGDDAFVDPDLPVGFAPFGIHALEGRVYVTYAAQDNDSGELQTGSGRGFVSAFDTGGAFEVRIASEGLLDAPWAVVRAPADFGLFSGALLVGNVGDGRITAFDADGDVLLGQLRLGTGDVLRIDGLRGMTFGNDRDAGEADHLYFTAAPDDPAGGAFGEIAAGEDLVE